MSHGEEDAISRHLHTQFNLRFILMHGEHFADCWAWEGERTCGLRGLT